MRTCSPRLSNVTPCQTQWRSVHVCLQNHIRSHPEAPVVPSLRSACISGVFLTCGALAFHRIFTAFPRRRPCRVKSAWVADGQLDDTNAASLCHTLLLGAYATRSHRFPSSEQIKCVPQGGVSLQDQGPPTMPLWNCHPDKRGGGVARILIMVSEFISHILCFKHFTCFISFISQTSLEDIMNPFHRRGNRGSRSSTIAAHYLTERWVQF